MRSRAIALTVVTLGWLAASAFAASAQTSNVPAATPAAQPANTDDEAAKTEEEIIVLGQKPGADRIIHNFIRSYTAPSPIGQIARWKAPICPTTMGLSPAYGKFITARVREIAAMIGASVDAHEPCHTNVQIIFTIQPQILLDGIAEKTPSVLGFHYAAQRKKLATVSHPIQAWYATATADRNGDVQFDDSDGFRTAFVEGSLLRTGLRSEFALVTIVADLDKVNDTEIGPIADYIAMLALSPAKAFDACQELPSITNLMSPTCDPSRKANAITASDIAYLKGLYKLDSDMLSNLQEGDIAFHMKQALGNK